MCCALDSKNVLHINSSLQKCVFVYSTLWLSTFKVSVDIVSLQTQGNQIFWVVFIVIYVVCISMLTILVYYIGRWRLCKLFLLLSCFFVIVIINSSNCNCDNNINTVLGFRGAVGISLGSPV